ncbi:MAG: cbb3-type cytochrome oxidase assembly protein CcoS [Pusillimonas sp.]|nr:cbb3-type cytochrome oxidase assembly protein CcoS [Pusillimonas sp.]MDX3894814.1 cbb3-type cytochrome oxidase assembly protein CcoS [Pusillimonas sp.]
MEAMFLLIAISLVFVVAIGAAFWWAIFAGQFDDSDSAGKSILGDEDENSGAPPKSHDGDAGGKKE